MLNLDKFCRLCLSTDGLCVPLFDDSDKNGKIPLYKKVMRCVSVKIENGDGLPSQLCRSCINQVNSILSFKETCENIDESLRSFLKENNISDNNELEARIQSIALECHSLSSFAIRYKKKSNSSTSKTSCPIKKEKEDSSNQALLKVETIFHMEDEGSWPEPPSTPASSSSPSPPPSPQSANFKKDEDSSERSPTKKKKKERRKKEYVCEFCGKKFPRSNHLTQHELTHTAEKPFHCSDCNKSFWYKASLIGHIKQTHTGDVNYTCELCGKGFFKKTELTRHKPTHFNETPHKCPQCGMGFKITKTLKRHIRNVHAAQRSHTCHTCGKSFTQLQTLKVHLVLHSGVKPYVCSYCGKGFSQSAPLKTHVRIHTGEKPYSCYACGDTFATRSALTTHAFKHNGSLPYPCTRCPSTFRLKRDLIQHEQGHDDEESRLGRTATSVAETENLANEEQQEQKEVQQQLLTQHQHPQTGNQFPNNDNNSHQILLSHQQTVSQAQLPQPIPASHTVGRANPPIFHRQQFTPASSLASTTSQELPIYPLNHVQELPPTHANPHTQTHISSPNQSHNHMQQISHIQPQNPNIQHPLQTHSHGHINAVYENRL